MNDIIYNGTALSTFKCFTNQNLSFTEPEKDYELVEVMGKHGSLSIYNDRFQNVDLAIPCYIHENFIENYRNLMRFLNSQCGYQKLEFTMEPDYYREALLMNLTEPTVYPFAKNGSFVIVFSCKPQRFLKSGDTPVSADADDYIDNPTLFESYPLIRCYGTGTVNINDQYITISAHPYEYIDIDCELMDAKYGLNNANQYVSFSTTDYITLKVGDNYITHDLTTVEITPRWFEI